jgi:hypothetical protein
MILIILILINLYFLFWPKATKKNGRRLFSVMDGIGFGKEAHRLSTARLTLAWVELG